MLSEPIHVNIIGKNEIVREGLKRILADQDFSVDCAVSCVDDLDIENEPSLIIIDVNDIDEGLSVCADVRERCPKPRIVIMTDGFSMEDVSRAFATGDVDGYLVKEISCDPLAGALRLTALGEKVLPSQIASSLASAPAGAISRCWDMGASGTNLSAREVDILRCLVDGEPNKVISRRLSIADATVKVRIKAILRKLRVRNRTQAAIWAVNRGLAGEAPVNATPALRPQPPFPAALPPQRAPEIQLARAS
ncbi:LuxR C-terminal-related transcriptional regulator [Sphingomonas koreensis]|uniref:LuxR C-terminal-related transcriptional regulator n=1 Tax=Sphingomonas koreensis TaxID=93064 RepID=UPI000F7D7A88|nr:response regulator transcription factor [Sphingomonas koreensis]RSU86911.1 DNA-binding response regulator [Sphingomonas koreensis]